MAILPVRIAGVARIWLQGQGLWKGCTLCWLHLYIIYTEPDRQYTQPHCVQRGC